MSIPSNPLDSSSASSYRHVLVAFKYAEDAFKFKNFTPTSATVGGSFPDVGDNVVVVNELRDQRFSIPEAIWDFNFIPNIGVSTTSSVGKIVVVERYVPYSFLNFLEHEVLAVLNEGTDDLMSLSHATFVLKTYFALDDNGEGVDTNDIIQVNPFYFNIDSIESVPSAKGVTPATHIIHALGASNTTGLLRSFSSVFQMNITHKDGNLHDTIPEGTGSEGIKTRSAENSKNTSKRKERLDLSKRMVSLRDMFEGFAADLNQQKVVHQAQLQEWRRQIRSDNQPDKIVVAPQQTKKPTPKQLPMDFVIDLDPIYNDYKVDNRNMPFEQPEIWQPDLGIRVLPIRPGAQIFEVVEKIMMLSKKVGEDAVDPTGIKTFKTTITTKRLKTNKYITNIKIRQYDLPDNRAVENTGPGKAAPENALSFFVNDPEERDVDVIEFKSHINYQIGDNMLEQQNTEDVGAGVIYADREQATAERRADLPFFQTLYSGIRPMIASYGIDGLESAQRAGDIFNMMDRYTYTQSTDYEMVIRGNPHLMSDVNRNPDDVISDSDGDGVYYYARPEVDPMYVKLTIFQSSYSTAIGEGDNGDIPTRFYFDNYYHMTRVINMFGVGGGFLQKLILKRTDTLI